tara:strand:- start:902 stop:1498 length:597 start_codon:yes stop_codon:yes gene_type:complete
MKQQVKITQVKGNPNNPRIIKNDKFKKLVKSIQEFPEMLKLRPIVVDENMIVLGGNMRLKASKDAGLKEVWIEIAEGLTDEQKKEFIVKDNVGFGEWEWDILANEWDSIQLAEWGLDVWKNIDDIDELDADQEWVGMPEFNQLDKMPYRQIIVSFDKESDVQDFANIMNENITQKTKSFWFPKKEKNILKDKAYVDES